MDMGNIKTQIGMIKLVDTKFKYGTRMHDKIWLVFDHLMSVSCTMDLAPGFWNGVKDLSENGFGVAVLWI